MWKKSSGIFNASDKLTLDYTSKTDSSPDLNKNKVLNLLSTFSDVSEGVYKKLRTYI